MSPFKKIHSLTIRGYDAQYSTVSCRFSCVPGREVSNRSDHPIRTAHRWRRVYWRRSYGPSSLPLLRLIRAGWVGGVGVNRRLLLAASQCKMRMTRRGGSRPRVARRPHRGRIISASSDGRLLSCVRDVSVPRITGQIPPSSRPLGAFRVCLHVAVEQATRTKNRMRWDEMEWDGMGWGRTGRDGTEPNGTEWN